MTFSRDGSDLKAADAVVVVVGEQPYAEMKGDRSDLHLAAADVALVEKAKAAGVPVVTVLISGRLPVGSAEKRTGVQRRIAGGVAAGHGRAGCGGRFIW